MQVSEQIIAVLDNLAQKFGVAIDWGQKNVLPYIQQLCVKYITWEIATSIVWICLSTTFIALGCVLYKLSSKWHETYKDEWDYDGIGRVLLIAAAIVCWIITLGIVTEQVFDIVKCCIFPELQVFEFVKSLMVGTPN